MKHQRLRQAHADSSSFRTSGDRGDPWRVTFGTFMGGLVLLLILLYSGVPIVYRTSLSLGGRAEGTGAAVPEEVIRGRVLPPPRRSLLHRLAPVLFTHLDEVPVNHGRGS